MARARKCRLLSYFERSLEGHGVGTVARGSICNYTPGLGWRDYFCILAFAVLWSGSDMHAHSSKQLVFGCLCGGPGRIWRTGLHAIGIIRAEYYSRIRQLE